MPRPAVELARHLLAEDLRERVRGLGAQLVLLVDRRVVGRRVEREAERRLARRPHDALQAQARGGGEDRVGARDVRAEGQVGRGVHGGGDRREMHDRLDARQLLGVAERLDRLAVVGEVGGQERRRRVRRARLRRRHPVDVDDLMAVLEQIPDDGAPGLPTASGDRDLRHVRDPFSRALGPGRGGSSACRLRRCAALTAASREGRSGGRSACCSARVGGSRPAGRGVPAHFARVSQHLRAGPLRSNVGLPTSGRGRTDVRRSRLQKVLRNTRGCTRASLPAHATEDGRARRRPSRRSLPCAPCVAVPGCGVPAHFARVPQHLPPGRGSNVGLPTSGGGRTDVRRRCLQRCCETRAIAPPIHTRLRTTTRAANRRRLPSPSVMLLGAAQRRKRRADEAARHHHSHVFDCDCGCSSPMRNPRPAPWQNDANAPARIPRGPPARPGSSAIARRSGSPQSAPWSGWRRACSRCATRCSPARPARRGPCPRPRTRSTSAASATRSTPTTACGRTRTRSSEAAWSGRRPH